MTSFSLGLENERQSPSHSGEKRSAESERHGHGVKAPLYIDVVEAGYNRDIDVSRLYDPLPTDATSEWSRDAIKSGQPQPQPHSPAARPFPHMSAPKAQRQPDLIELPRYDPGLLLQPDNNPISREQLASEAKSIYAGLTMVETKCIHVDGAQAAAAQDSSNPNHKLASDHWQALIALHRTLLHEHHDFFLTSQHPSASPALRRVAAKHSMPARMWKHGIHSFLEVLRCHLPNSIDYMLSFICLAYQIVALLYETVPDFKDTWIEYLGDLACYRTAIEDEDVRDRETWANVARSWCMFHLSLRRCNSAC
jgi:hypothetical protein